MPRSTNVQKAARLNAAHRLLARGISLAEATMVLSRDLGISRRQAYRYLQEAREIGRPVPIAEASLPITLKIPGNVIRDLRTYATGKGLTLSEVVTRAVAAFLAATRKHG
jgi:predicted DNA-binding transcriptional regulator YafY